MRMSWSAAPRPPPSPPVVAFASTAAAGAAAIAATSVAGRVLGAAPAEAVAVTARPPGSIIPGRAARKGRGRGRGPPRTPPQPLTMAAGGGAGGSAASARGRRAPSPARPPPLPRGRPVVPYPANTSPPPPAPGTLRIAVIGDVHGDWSARDSAALAALSPSAALFVGDYGNEEPAVVSAILRSPTAVAGRVALVFGNHDAWYTATPSGRRNCPYDRTLVDPVGDMLAAAADSHVSYGWKRVDLGGEKDAGDPAGGCAGAGVAVVGGRPFSWGGPFWKHAPFYRDYFGVADGAGSTRQLVAAVRGALGGARGHVAPFMRQLRRREEGGTAAAAAAAGATAAAAEPPADMPLLADPPVRGGRPATAAGRSAAEPPPRPSPSPSSPPSAPASTGSGTSTLLFLSHNGPTGLGADCAAPCGKDWGAHPGGDYGDPDLRAGVDEARAAGARVPLVTFGHMHERLAQGAGWRRMVVVEPDRPAGRDARANGDGGEGGLAEGEGAGTPRETVFLNAAVVPRVMRHGSGQGVEGSLHHFMLVELRQEGGAPAAAVPRSDHSDGNGDGSADGSADGGGASTTGASAAPAAPRIVWGVHAVDQVWARPDGRAFTSERLYEAGRGVLPRGIAGRDVPDLDAAVSKA